MSNCQDCNQENSTLPSVTCDEPVYTAVNCDEFPLFKCLNWGGSPIACLNINTGDKGDVVINKIASSLCGLVDPSYSARVRVSATDTTQGYLFDKLVAGSGISLVKGNSGGNETLSVAVDTATFNTPIVVNSTDNSITRVLSGVANHTLDLGIAISPNANNGLSKLSNGLFVSASDSKTKVSISDTSSGYLLSKIIGGVGVTITQQNIGGNETLLINAPMVGGISSVNSTDSSTIDFSGLGTTGSALTAQLKLSNNVNNILSVDGDGLLGLISSTKVSIANTDSIILNNTGNLSATLKVDPSVNNAITISGTGVFSKIEQNLVTTSSTSLVLSTSGIFGHNLTGNVVVSPNIGNSLQSLPSGLFVSSSTYTAGSGITISSGTISNSAPDQVVTLTAGTGLSVSGTYPGFTLTNSAPDQVVSLTAGTNVSITGTYPNFTINATGGGGGSYTASDGINISGSDIRLGGILNRNVNVNAQSYMLSISGTSATLNTNGIPFASSGVVDYTGSETNQYATTGVYGNFKIQMTGTVTPFSKSKHSAIAGNVIQVGTGTFAGIAPSFYAGSDFSGTGTVDTVAGIRITPPLLTVGQSYGGTITNFAAVYIDSVLTSDIIGNITNRYGIYQIGTNETNVFNGSMKVPNLPVFADNSAASSLAAGTFYRTSTGQVMVKY